MKQTVSEPININDPRSSNKSRMTLDTESSNKAYMEGLRLKDSNWDEDAIYSKLEKQGFDPTLAKQVAKDVMIERENEKQQKQAYYFNAGIVFLGLGVLIQVLSIFVFSNVVIFPIGLVVTGLIMIIICRPKKSKNT